MRTARVVIGAVGSLLVVAALGGPSAAQILVDGFSETTVLSGLDGPTALAFLPDGRMLLTQGDGTVMIVNDGTPALLAQIPVSYCGLGDYETGPLGMAVDPDFSNNGFLYFYRTEGTECAPERNEVLRLTVGPGDTVDLGTLQVLVDEIHADMPYHQGGCLRIGPDDKLYVGTGENFLGDQGTTGPGTSTNPYAQDLSVLMGKILRLELNGTAPADNPFVGVAGACPEIFSYGFRNPWRFDFDPQTGSLWVGDVGQEDVEEIDRVTAGSNQGWPQCEGNLPTNCAAPADSKPVFTYPHEGPKSLGECVVGGAFAPSNFGFDGGLYFFGDFESSTIWRAQLNAARTKFKGKVVAFAENAYGPVDFVFGPDGALYYSALFAGLGEVRRIGTPASGGGQPLAGTNLKLAAGAKKSLSVLSQDAIDLGGGDDNPLLGGGSLRVAGTGFDNTYDLPAGNWKLIGKAPDKVTGFKYTDPKKLAGPIGSVKVQRGKQVSIKGAGDALQHVIGDTDPGPVTVTLHLGGRSYCMSFGGTTSLVPGKVFTATDAPAPGSCP